MSKHNQKRDHKSICVFGRRPKLQMQKPCGYFFSIGYLVSTCLCSGIKQFCWIDFCSFTNNVSARAAETCCAELSRELRHRMAVLWETCERINRIQPLKMVSLPTEKEERVEGQESRKRRRLGGHNRQKLPSVRLKYFWRLWSQQRLSLSIMQYTYVPSHGLIHFSATSDMEDLHLGFLLIFCGSGGDELV